MSAWHAGHDTSAGARRKDTQVLTLPSRSRSCPFVLYLSGRKNASLLYCITYTASCVTKHWNNFKVLMLGRLLGGIATSLLFTAFEAWLVSEHNRRGFEPAWLSGTFSKAVFLGNGLVAIVAGLVANSLVGQPFQLGPVSPFDAAACCLTLGGVIIATTWSENYGGDASKKSGKATTNDDDDALPPSTHGGGGGGGEGEAQPRGSQGDLAGLEEPTGASPSSSGVSAAFAGVVAQFRRGARAIASDPRVGLLGAMQSLFEASMYSFVFLWTPALSPRGEVIPHGMIFATFMLSCMIGSSVASRLLSRTDTRPEVFMQTVFALAAAALSTPVLVYLAGVTPDTSPSWARAGGVPGGMTFAGQLQFLAFNVFEACVGVFWPSMMKMRAQYVPEELRSTIMNMFRIPLNLFVCVILYNVSLFPIWFMFSMCVIFLYAASVAQGRLDRMTAHAHAEKLAAAASEGAGAEAGA